MKRKRHTLEEIADKLNQAGLLAAQGKSQPEIAKALGVSVMTYHRWRKDHTSAARVSTSQPASAVAEMQGGGPSHSAAAEEQGGRAQRSRIAELQVENARLRRLVADLLLEKVRLEEVLDRGASNRSLDDFRVSRGRA
jgi:putative transposase